MYKLFTWVKGGIDLSKFHSGVPRERILEIINREGKRIHFIGAEGVGMRPLMKLSRELSHTVSGSDREGSREEGVFLGHSEEHAKGKDLVVYSLAIDDENPETSYAEKKRIPTVSRAEYLGALMEGYKVRIGVSGSHGKSTTSAMLDKIFCD